MNTNFTSQKKKINKKYIKSKTVKLCENKNNITIIQTKALITSNIRNSLR